MKIVNIGSLNIDRVYAVSHFVKAGETLASESLEFFAGGKGLNQSVALAAAGAPVCHAGMVGEDGAMLTRFLSSRGVNTKWIRTVEGSSGHAVIQVERGGQNCILLYGGANRMLTGSYVEEVLEDTDPGDIVLIQNETSCLESILKAAERRKLRVALNPSPIDENLPDLPLGAVSWFILNEIEGRALSGETRPEKILDVMRRRYPHSSIVLTLGKKGVVCDGLTGRCHHGIYRVPVVDTTAAGDTFTGYFLACAMRDVPPEECLRIASVASSLAVSRSGAAPSIPTMREVLDAKLEPDDSSFEQGDIL